MVDLPAVPWTQRADLASLVAALGADSVRWVGGAVRDTLLGNPVSDVDAATLHEPEAVTSLLEQAGLRAIPTGIDHGTVTVPLPDGKVEVTTLRRDVSTDGRRATVAFATDWRDDAARRDFTINALYVHPLTLEVFDWFGGLEDLAAKRIRFIGDARQRIREDHLRILRYYRFQARYGSALDEAAEEACAELAPMLKGLSRERVAMELLNLLALPDPSPTVARMVRRGVLQVVLPGVGEENAGRLAVLVRAELAQGVDPHPLRRLATLLPSDVADADKVAAGLRLSSAQRKRLALALRSPEGQRDARVLAYERGREEAIDHQLLSGGSIAALDDWMVPVFPLKGGDIVNRGVSAGPEVARILQAVEARWKAEGFPSRERVLAMLDEALA